MPNQLLGNSEIGLDQYFRQWRLWRLSILYCPFHTDIKLSRSFHNFSDPDFESCTARRWRSYSSASFLGWWTFTTGSSQRPSLFQHRYNAFLWQQDPLFSRLLSYEAITANGACLPPHPSRLGSIVSNPDRMSDIICELEFFQSSQKPSCRQKKQSMKHVW